RVPTDAVDSVYIRHALTELVSSDIAVVVVDAADGVATGMPGEPGPGAARIVVHNKIDLVDPRAAPGDGCRAGDLGHGPPRAHPRAERRDGAAHIWLSAHTRDGLELLVAELKRHAGLREAGVGAFSARARHVAALER